MTEVIPKSIEIQIGVYWESHSRFAKQSIPAAGQAAADAIDNAFTFSGAKIAFLFNYHNNKAEYPAQTEEWIIGRSIWQAAGSVAMGIPAGVLARAAPGYVAVPFVVAAGEAGSEMGGVLWEIAVTVH